MNSDYKIFKEIYVNLTLSFTVLFFFANEMFHPTPIPPTNFIVFILAVIGFKISP